MTHTVSLMRYHYPAKEETGRGEQLQLHDDGVSPIRSVTFTPRYCLAVFIMGHHEKVEHAARQSLKQNNTICLGSTET